MESPSRIFLSVPERASTSRAGMTVDQLTQGSWVLLFLWLVLVAIPPSRRTHRLEALADSGSQSDSWAWCCSTSVQQATVRCFADAPRVAAASAAVASRNGQHRASGLVGLLLTVLLMFGSAVSLFLRLRRSDGEDRVRLLWPVWGALSIPAVLMFGWANHFVLGDQPAGPSP